MHARSASHTCHCAAGTRTWSPLQLTTIASRGRTCRCPSPSSPPWSLPHCCSAPPPSWAPPQSSRPARQPAWWCVLTACILCQIGRCLRRFHSMLVNSSAAPDIDITHRRPAVQQESGKVPVICPQVPPGKILPHERAAIGAAADLSGTKSGIPIDGKVPDASGTSAAGGRFVGAARALHYYVLACGGARRHGCCEAHHVKCQDMLHQLCAVRPCMQAATRRSARHTPS